MGSRVELEKIDVHDARNSYLAGLTRLRTDDRVSPESKSQILEFLRDCQLGKTVLGRQKKKIGDKRLAKMLSALLRLNEWLGNKDFRLVSQDDMERFVSLLESNRLTLKKDGTDTPVKYMAWSRRDFKVILRKFYKWLLGDNRSYPDLVSWIDTSIQEGAPPSLSLDEIRRCQEFAPSIRGKALIWALFETGARAEEFLNIRLCHVSDKTSHFAISIEFPKTYKRTVPMFEGASYLRDWLGSHPSPNNPTAQLFPMTYGGLRMFLRRVGLRAIGRPVHPHLLRDSLATWLASKRVGRYQMCKVMGWAMSSGMPDRYIDRTGVIEEEAIQSIRGDDLSRSEKENAVLRSSLAKLEAKANELQQKLEERSQVDALVQALARRPDVANLLAGLSRSDG